MIFQIAIITCVAMLCLTLFTSKHIRYALKTLALITYCLLIATKGKSGSDAHIYVPFFEEINSNENIFLEPGLWFFFSTLKTLNLPFELVNITHALIVYYSLSKLSKNNLIAPAIYITFFGISLDFSMLRQSIAFHLFNIIFRKNINLRLMAIAFSATFHATTLVNAIAVTKKKYMLATFICLLPATAYYIYIYSDYQEYLTRPDSKFIMQVLAVAFVYTLSGASKTITTVTALLFTLPIGFRIAVYALPYLGPLNISKISRLILATILISTCTLKTISFAEQSITNDGTDSTTLHFDHFFQ